jgi:hypothetical protein
MARTARAQSRASATLRPDCSAQPRRHANSGDDRQTHVSFNERLGALTPEILRGIRRGLEKESLRVQADGRLAATPHPAG